MRPMKESGVEWIGEIPENWEIHQIKKDFRVYSGATPKSDNPDNWDGEIVWITPADYKTEDKYVSVGKRNISEIGYASCGTTLVPKNSIVFSKRAPIGTVAIAQNDLCTNQGCLSCVAQRNAFPVYYYYAMSAFPEQFNLYGTGTTFKEISFDSFCSFKLPHPNTVEQQRIASFLDRKCAEIDAVMEQTRQTIEEYKKLKQSIITEAVTKGVRGPRPMKDSGIEWIGEIPEEWEVHKLCWDYEAMLGKMLDAKRISGTKLHPYIKNADVQWWEINLEHLDEMDFEDDEYERYSIRPRDLMICEGGEIGKCAVVPEGISEGIFYQKALHRVRSRNEKQGNTQFLSYVIFCMAKLDAFETTHEKATIQHLPGDALSQLRIPAPTMSEQHQIVDYLTVKCNEIDQLIKAKRQLLAELETYKKSLIYEYVTGKKEVPPCP